MILRQIQIHCSNTDEPDNLHCWTWNAGDDFLAVERAAAKLQEWVDEQKASPLAIALAPDNNEPIAKP